MRRPTSSNDSLELLLDTICNTFGGIVFLALLVCVLAQNTVPDQDDAAVVRQQVRHLAEARLAEALQDVAALEVAKAEQLKLAELLQSRASDPQSSLSADAARLRVQRRVLLGEVQDLEAALERVRREASRSEREVKEAVAVTDRAQRDATKVNAEAARVRRERAMALRLPKARPTGKQQVPVLMANGRLRMPLQYGKSGIALGRNFDELAATAPPAVLRPSDFIPGSGTLVEETEASRRAVDARFVPFNPRDKYVCVALWPDSYSEFKIVRDWLVKKGFEYQVILLDADDAAVAFGPGGPGEVQ